MAEDDETATARYIAGNISTRLMLKTIIEIISTMVDDPDNYRAGLKKKRSASPGTPLCRNVPGAMFARWRLQKPLSLSMPESAWAGPRSGALYARDRRFRLMSRPSDRLD